MNSETTKLVSVFETISMFFAIALLIALLIAIYDDAKQDYNTKNDSIKKHLKESSYFPQKDTVYKQHIKYINIKEFQKL